MGILSGPAIANCVEAGDIAITPFDGNNINPSSIDLRLGDEVRLYEDWVDCSAADHHKFVDEEYEVTHFDGSGLISQDYMSYVQDIKEPARTRKFRMNEGAGWVLHPGILYLMHTLERVHTERFVPVLDGKSSIGRLGITIHLTAGFGDPGYNGQYTLEVTTMHPVRVYPGMRFCQMRFHHLDGKLLNYKDTGHYTDGASQGAVASLAYTQFEGP